MGDQIVSVPDHCLSFYFEISDKETRDIILSRQRTTKVLISLRGCAGRSAPLLFAYGKNRFSHDEAQFDSLLYLFFMLCYTSTLSGPHLYFRLFSQT